jgi:hypothetical protein
MADAPGCPAPASSVLYVDSSTAGGHNGSQQCPFPTIAAALDSLSTSPAPTTIHVAAGVYREMNLVVPRNVTLSGAGTGDAGSTTIISSSTKICDNVSYCAVTVNAGGIIEQVVIQIPNGLAVPVDGIYATGGVAGEPVPTVRDVLVTGASGSGIVTSGAATIGPGVTSTQSGVSGLNCVGTGVVTVAAGTPENHFDDNKNNGIGMYGLSTLDFEGGTASHNAANGVELDSATSGHTIKGLTATGNLGVGGVNVIAHVATGSDAGTPLSLVLRGSNLSGNARSGLTYDFGTAPPVGTASPLDIGEDGTAGDNIFESGTKPPTGVGLLLCNARRAQALAGDTFSTCPVTAVHFSECTPSGGYVDVGYSGPTNPLSGCTCADGGTICN